MQGNNAVPALYEIHLHRLPMARDGSGHPRSNGDVPVHFRFMKLSRVRVVAAAVVALVSLGACAELTGNAATRQAAVSFHVPAAGSSLAASASLVPITADGHTVDVTSIDVVLSEVTFEHAGASGGDADSDDSDADSDSDGAHNEQVRVGASTVALPLTGGVVTPFTGSIPAGTYDGLELDVEFLRIRGTYDGQPFDVTLPVNAEVELDITPPLVVTGGGDPLNVTVNVDVLSWFRAVDGSVVDPRRLQTDAAYRAGFIARIRASLHATEDSDRDGDEADSDSDDG